MLSFLSPLSGHLYKLFFFFWECLLQKRRSSRQVKRKRYTEDLEFRISDDDGDDSPGPKSPTTSEQQVNITSWKTADVTCCLYVMDVLTLTLCPSFLCVL